MSLAFWHEFPYERQVIYQGWFMGLEYSSMSRGRIIQQRGWASPLCAITRAIALAPALGPARGTRQSGLTDSSKGWFTETTRGVPEHSPDNKNIIAAVYSEVGQFISRSASLCIKDASDRLPVKINRQKVFHIHSLERTVTLLFI